MTAGHRRWPLLLAAVLGATGVAAGAFGAHTIADSVSPSRLAVWETAARYQLFHALAVLALAWPRGELGGTVVWTLRLWGLGTLLFAGSLYALVLLDWPQLGALTPLGGVALIGGWCLLATTALRRR